MHRHGVGMLLDDLSHTLMDVGFDHHVRVTRVKKLSFRGKVIEGSVERDGGRCATDISTVRDRLRLQP